MSEKRIKMITTYAGPKKTVIAGKEDFFESKEADALIAGGYAELARSKPVEKAIDKIATEKAVVETEDKKSKPIVKGKSKKKE